MSLTLKMKKKKKKLDVMVQLIKKKIRNLLMQGKSDIQHF